MSTLSLVRPTGKLYDELWRYDPLLHLAMFPRASLRYDDLPIGTIGLTDHRTRSVTLAHGLSGAEARCTLAHELVHLERGPILTSSRSGDKVGSAEWVEEAVIETIVAARMIPARELLGLAARVEREGVDAVSDELGVDDYTITAGINLAAGLMWDQPADLELVGCRSESA